MRLGSMQVWARVVCKLISGDWRASRILSRAMSPISRIDSEIQQSWMLEQDSPDSATDMSQVLSKVLTLHTYGRLAQIIIRIPHMDSTI